MIVDRVEYYNYYPYGSAWKTAFEFLGSITSDAEEKRYDIQNDDIHAIVACYKTKEPHKFEAHRKYVDIQFLLEGQENIESTALNGLTVDISYDAEKDVETYEQTDNRKIITHLMPGMFIAFFPQDAHMPGVSAGGSTTFVKKAVVKIKTDLLIF